MTWGVVLDVPAPVEVYDAVHAELLRRTDALVDGLLVHLARETDRGFEVLEVWESRADFERYQVEVVEPVLAEFTGGRTLPAGDPVEFEARGLVLPRSGIIR
jgi:hypothetical protein